MSNEKESRECLIINETPHYPVTITSYRHLLEFAQDDGDISHPLGVVYRTKIAHPDNAVRIVVVRKENDHIGLSAFVFDKAIWFRYRNPYSPVYDGRRALFHDNMGVIKHLILNGVNRAKKIIVDKIRLRPI